MPGLDLSKAMAQLLAFRDARDWQQFHFPKELATALGIEASELQELFLWRERETSAEVRKDHERALAIESEVADVAIYLLLLSHELGIDLGHVIGRKLRENEKRYSITAHKGVARKAVQRAAPGDKNSGPRRARR